LGQKCPSAASVALFEDHTQSAGNILQQGEHSEESVRESEIAESLISYSYLQHPPRSFSSPSINMHSPQAGIDTPLNAISTTPTVTRDAGSDSESDNGELPHKLVKSQLKSVITLLQPPLRRTFADSSILQ